MPRKKEDRIKFASTVKKELYDNLIKISEDTKIPISKLIDEAIELLILKRKE